MQKVLAADVRNIVRKAAKGKVLTQHERELLIQHQAAQAPKPKAVTADDEGERVWVTPAALMKWLPTQGVKISKKSLFKTYLGANATHPVTRNADGKRVHRFQALEMIRLVQQGGAGENDELGRVALERAIADARMKSARAAQMELRLEEAMGQRIRVELVYKVLGKATENVTSELRTLEHNLPDELANKSAAEIQPILAKAFHALRQHLAVTFEKQEEAVA